MRARGNKERNGCSKQIMRDESAGTCFWLLLLPPSLSPQTHTFVVVLAIDMELGGHGLLFLEGMKKCQGQFLFDDADDAVHQLRLAFLRQPGATVAGDVHCRR